MIDCGIQHMLDEYNRSIIEEGEILGFDGETLGIVDAVLDKKKNKENTLGYVVKWKGGASKSW